MSGRTQTIIPGFNNKDNVSCYANAVIQCMYNCEDVKTLIRNNDSICNELKTNLTKYETGRLGNTKTVRVRVNDIYEEEEQQDVIEFIEDFLEMSEELEKLFAFTITETSVCQECRFTRSTNSVDKILRIPVQHNLKDITDIISHMYGQFGSCLEGYTCENCGKQGEVRQKYEITSASKYLILQFLIFDNDSNKLYFNIPGVPRTRLEILGSVYHPSSAIFHYGRNIFKGHYVAYLNIDSHWVCADDRLVSMERWPYSAHNMYVLIMKK